MERVIFSAIQDVLNLPKLFFVFFRRQNTWTLRTKIFRTHKYAACLFILPLPFFQQSSTKMDCIYWSMRLAKTRNELAKSFTPKSKNEQNIKVVSKCLRPSSKTMETGKVSQGKQSRPLICHTIYIAVCHAPDVRSRQVIPCHASLSTRVNSSLVCFRIHNDTNANWSAGPLHRISDKEKQDARSIVWTEFRSNDITKMMLSEIMAFCRRMCFCASLLRISVVTKVLSFVSALNSRKHVNLNNEKIRLVTYPKFF